MTEQKINVSPTRKLFRDEVVGQLEPFNSHLSELATKPDDKKALEQISMWIAQLKVPSRLAKLDVAYRLVKCLDSLLEVLVELGLPVRVSDQKLIDNAVGTLVHVAESGLHCQDPRDELIEAVGRVEARLVREQEALRARLPQHEEQSPACRQTKPVAEAAQVPEPEGQPARPAASSLADDSLQKIFLQELSGKLGEMTNDLVALESGQATTKRFVALMRNAHTIKCGARLSGFDPIFDIAHVIEDISVAAQENDFQPEKPYIDTLLQATDFIGSLANCLAEEDASVSEQQQARLREIVASLRSILGDDFHPLEPSDEAPNPISGSAPPSSGETPAEPDLLARIGQDLIKTRQVLSTLGESILDLQELMAEQKEANPAVNKAAEIASHFAVLDRRVLAVSDDVSRFIDRPVASDAPVEVDETDNDSACIRQKRVLVVDDSLTIREVERHLLQAAGYMVDVVVDGMDGWNAIRQNEYDLVVSDVDMPRMDGVELATRIREDSRLCNLPIIIVSFKYRQEERVRGLNAGVDHYLTKDSFEDESFMSTVVDLIGAA
jgi:CheY-like chemotaxis protein